MKTRFLMLLAAVLLSVTAFAQSGSSEPKKGDVNDDGTVDVADIVAVIGIIKNGQEPVEGLFYLGTTQPTAENYQSLQGVVATYTSFDQAVGATATVAAGETIYMLCPAKWMEKKNAALEDKDGNTVDFLEDKDATTISGYVIYKTQAWNGANSVTLKTTTYKYYAGVTDKVSFTTSDLTQSTTTKPTTLTFAAAPAGTNNYQTFVYPSSWGKPTSMMAGGLDGKDGWFWGTDAGMESLPSGYTAGVHQGGAVTYTVTW